MGYSPKRWQTALDVMLQKKEGVFDVSKLQTIGLMEADFNFICKYIGKWAMEKVEDYKQLAKEQYRSRKNHTAIAQALNKCLTFDMAMLQKTSTILCSQDAMSCFDRILHAALALGLRRQNIPDTAKETVITTIQYMVHKVRTTFGKSVISYRGKIPHQGIPQGNGLGPPGWDIISPPCLESLQQKRYGAKFLTPISNKMIVFVGYAYIDDTEQVETENYEGKNIKEIIKRMQKAIDLWEKSIKITGGAIQLEKCHWYVLNFKWDGSTYKLSTKIDLPYELTVIDTNGIRQIIKRKEYNKSKETLGVHCTPNGNMKHQIERMVEQSQDWADKISCGHMNRANIAIALRTTIWKTLGYPLSATLLNKEECKKNHETSNNGSPPKNGS